MKKTSNIIVMFAILSLILSLRISQCNQSNNKLIQLNNETARENYDLKKKFNLLSSEDLKPKG